MAKNNAYWRARRLAHEHMKEQLKADDAYKKRIARLYRTAQEEIIRDIEADIGRFADSQGLSMSEAKLLIKKHDVETFASKAERYVKEKNFSDEANRGLKLYNVTMRTNRLELLESRIHLELTAMADEENGMLQEWLAKQALEEFERQAGILGQALPDRKQLLRKVRSLVSAEYKGATFSDRIWQNQRELQHELERTLRRTIIRGENPRVAGRELRKIVREEFTGKDGKGGAKYLADRIAITESGRVQTIVQEETYKEYDIEQYIFISEIDACSDCLALDGEVFNVKDMRPGENANPIHSFCRCSTSGYVDRQAFEADLTRRGL